MRRKHSIKFACCLLLGLSAKIGFAADPVAPPATQPAPVIIEVQAAPDSTAPVPDDGNKRRPFGEGPPGQRFGMRFPQISETDKTDAMHFMQANSLKRYTAIESLPDSNRKNRARDLVARNYLNWMQTKKENPELFAVILKRVKVEDEIFGLVTDLHKASPDKMESLQTALKEQVSALVDIGLQERQLRLSRLQKTVDEQQQKLADDSKHRSDLIEERLKNILNEEKSPVPNSGTGAPHGHGPRPPGQ